MIKWDWMFLFPLFKKTVKKEKQNKDKINFNKYKLLKQHLKYNFVWSLKLQNASLFIPFGGISPKIAKSFVVFIISFIVSHVLLEMCYYLVVINI